MLLLAREDVPVSRLLLGLEGVEAHTYRTAEEAAEQVRRFLSGFPAAPGK